MLAEAASELDAKARQCRQQSRTVTVSNRETMMAILRSPLHRTSTASSVFPCSTTRPDPELFPIIPENLFFRPLITQRFD